MFERMLELNPSDNQGMRHPLLGLYLAANQPRGAQRIFSRYPGEEELMASFALARVLERWLAGETDEAKTALARAREINTFAERYISGTKALPREAPGAYKPGDDTEAQVCAMIWLRLGRAPPAYGPRRLMIAPPLAALDEPVCLARGASPAPPPHSTP